MLLKRACCAAVLLAALLASPAAAHPTMSLATQALDTPALVAGQPNIAGLAFTPDARVAPAFGFSAMRWWARLALPKDAGAAPFYVRIDSPSADRLAAFERCGGQNSGDQKSPDQSWRQLPRIRARYAVFETAPQSAGCMLLLRQETRAPVRFSVQVLRAADLAQADNETLIGADLGIAVAVCGMAAFLFQATGRREFLHFIAYQAATFLVILRIWGFVPGVVLGGVPALGGLIGIGGLNLWILAFFKYVESSLRVPQTRPRLHRWFDVLALSAMLAVAGEALGMRFQWKLTIVNMAAGILCWGTVVALQWRTERRRAMQQVLGYTPVLACFVIYLASLAGHAQLSDLRLLLLLGQIGTTLALGYWMALEFKQDRDRREGQLTATVGELRANRDMLERYQGDLESMVASRTAALHDALQSERAIVAQQRDFTAMIGHEFRTPLAVIDGQARRLARADTAEDEFTRRTREIRDAVRDMLGLMDGLMAHARHTGGAAEYRFAPTRLAELCRIAARNAVPPERAGDLRMTCAASLACKADAVMLSTAISNVLANAVKYSTSPSPIDLAAQECQGRLTITVTDRGVGIAAAEQAAVFAKFQRGTNVLATAGSGLGLFLARQIIEAHGGTITMSSMLGQGTAFTISLPALGSGQDVAWDEGGTA